MATLKDITRRLKSIKSIQKITKSMKMVSAAKYARAERDLKPARSYGTGAMALYEKAAISPLEKPKHLIIAISSDRGLCGAIHSNVAKAIKAQVAVLREAGKEAKIVSVGDKVRGILQRTHKENLLFHFRDVGKKPPTFGDASLVAGALLDSGYEFDQGTMYFNRFRSVVSYRTEEKPIYSLEAISSADTLSIYDDLDADVLRNYQEFSIANIIYYGLKESACSEQSSRMTSMDNATNNASAYPIDTIFTIADMITALTLKFNRTRQAVITRELIEIISGAAAI